MRSHLATHTLLLLHLLTSSTLFAFVVVVVVVFVVATLLLFFPLLLLLGLLSLFYFCSGWFFQGDFVWEMGGSMMGILRCCGFEEMIVFL